MSNPMYNVNNARSVRSASSASNANTNTNTVANNSDDEADDESNWGSDDGNDDEVEDNDTYTNNNAQLIPDDADGNVSDWSESENSDD